MSVSVPALITWAEDQHQSELLLQRIQFSDTARNQAPPIPYSIASRSCIRPFTRRHLRRRTTSTRLKDLVPDSDRPQTKGVGANSTWLKGHLTAEGEVANNATNDAGMSTRIDQRDDGAKRMVRMALTGTNGPVDTASRIDRPGKRSSTRRIRRFGKCGQNGAGHCQAAQFVRADLEQCGSGAEPAPHSTER